MKTDREKMKIDFKQKKEAKSDTGEVQQQKRMKSPNLNDLIANNIYSYHIIIVVVGVCLSAFFPFASNDLFPFIFCFRFIYYARISSFCRISHGSVMDRVSFSPPVCWSEHSLLFVDQPTSSSSNNKKENS